MAISQCKHERLNEDGICRQCGEDCRGGIGSPTRSFPNAGSASAAAKLIQTDYAGRTDRDNGTEACRILGMISGQESSPVLTDNDRTFITDMKYKMQVGGSSFLCSRKQLNWLRDINERLVKQ